MQHSENNSETGLEDHKPYDVFFKRAFVGLLGIMFIVAANFLVPSMGGNGFQLPPNIAMWACIAVLILLSLYKILLTDKVLISPLLLPLFIMCVVLIAPGLLHRQVDTREIVLRVAQVIGFFLLFFSISQYRLSHKQRKLVFYLLIIAALIQVAYALLQKYHNPEMTPAFLMLFLGVDKPPVGGFLQVNALSIFLVTSIVTGFYLVLNNPSDKKSIPARLLLIALMLGGGYVLAIISSRAALLALSLALPLLLFALWQQVLLHKKSLSLLLASLVLGLAAGFIMDTGVDRLEHKKMSSRLMAWSLSVDAIKEAPLTGHGLGGFARAFFDQIEKRNTETNAPRINRQVAFFTHPHNEILYWGVESGIFAMLGIVGFFIIYLRLLFKAYSFKQALQYLALLLPVGLSSMVSLPFYLSTFLLVLFVYLLLMPMHKLAHEKMIHLNELLKKVLIIIFGVIFIFYLWFLKEAIQGSINITRYIHLKDAPYSLLQKTFNNPYWGKLAINYAHQWRMNDLLNQGNKKEARKHLRWFEDQLAHEEEPMYYEVLLNAYPIFEEKGNYEQAREIVKKRYPYRFYQYSLKIKNVKPYD